MNTRKENIEILSKEVRALSDFIDGVEDSYKRLNLLWCIFKLQDYVFLYIEDENFCWKNGRKEDEAIQVLCKEIREIIGLGNEDLGCIDRVEAILLGAYDGFDVRELIGDKYCPHELSL